MKHPSQLGKYPITAVLGEGAMGVVYKAHDPGIGRPVAIKTVRAELLHDPLDAAPPGAEAADGMAARFRNEARAVGRISHPGIVAIYEYGEDQGTAFIAMEYVEGKTLAELLASGPLLPEPELLRVMDQLLDALDCAHQAGVWHRDIKPANLIVTASGRVKVTDFGIARIEDAGLTLVNAQIGTPGYMAPEQYTGEGVDHRADLYAAGVLLYRMLTGRKPFEGGAASVMFKVMNQDPVPPSQVAEAGRAGNYDAIIAKALAREASGRYASAAEFRSALAQRLKASLDAGSGITDIPTLLLRLPPVDPGATVPAALDGPTALHGSGSASRQAPAPTGAPAGTGASLSRSTGLPPTGWEPELLAQVERALASVVGPMAKVMVRQAARGNRELPALSQALAAQLDHEADRARFLSRLEAGTTHLTKTLVTSSGSSVGTATSGAGSSGATPDPGISEAQQAHALKVMTRHLGPIARILVKKALAQTSNPLRFAQLLADAADGANRDKVLKDLQGPG